MPSPSTALSTQRNDLGGSMVEFDLDMNQQGFIAHDVLPVIEVAKQSGSFGKIPIEQLLQGGETKRAPGAHYGRGSFTFLPATYACVEHGWEEPVDDNEATMYAEYFDSELFAAMRARSVVMVNAEKRAAALLFNAVTFTATNITNEWDDPTNAVPITDIEASVQRVYDASGLWPNTLIINRKVFRNLRLVAQIIDKLKYQGFVDVRAESITSRALAQLFDLDRIVVAGGSKNTAAEGQSASIAQIWSGEFAMVCRTATTGDIREPCAGRTFHWGEDGSEIGTHMESYREEQARGDIIRARHQVDELILHPEACDLMENITT